MRPLLSALAVTAWAYAALEAYRGAILDRIRDIVAARAIQTSSGAIVDWAASLRASWYGVVLDVLLFTFIIQLAVYGLWSLTYRATRGLLGAAAFFVAASVVGDPVAVAFPLAVLIYEP